MVAVTSPNYTAAISWNTTHFGILRRRGGRRRLPRAAGNDPGAKSAELSRAGTHPRYPTPTSSLPCNYPLLRALGSPIQQFPSLPSPPGGKTSGGSCSSLYLGALSSLIAPGLIWGGVELEPLEKSVGQCHCRGNRNTSVEAGRGGSLGFRPRREGTVACARATTPRAGPNPPFPKDDCEG